MKLKTLFAVLLISTMTINTSCDKDTFATMKADIAGVTWEASLASVIGANYSDYMTIVGFDLTGKKIFISIKATGPGTYNLLALEGSTETYAVYLLDKDDESDGTKKYLSTSGTVTITEFGDGKISGTFSFTAANSLDDSLLISNGVFDNVPYL